MGAGATEDGGLVDVGAGASEVGALVDVGTDVGTHIPKRLS